MILIVLFVFVLRNCTGSHGTEYQTTSVTRGAITQAVTATETLNPVINVQVGERDLAG